MVEMISNPPRERQVSLWAKIASPDGPEEVEGRELGRTFVEEGVSYW
jgi:hypothetical protein